ncbi:MAG: hypothetical protein RI897_3075 [Verrucomicrobiota bacterium]
MVMEGEKALEEEHGEEAGEETGGALRGGFQDFSGVRNEAEQAQAKHEAGDEADGDLKSCVGEFEAVG